MRKHGEARGHGGMKARRVVWGIALVLVLVICSTVRAEVTAIDIDRMVGETIASGTLPSSAQPAADDLNRHVEQMLAAGRLMPLIVVTGKTKVYAFDHPREVFQSISMALPYLTPAVRQKAIAWLSAEYDQSPPFDGAHYRLTGAPRCAGGNYDSAVEGAATIGRTERLDLGMYAFWAFCHFAQRQDLAQRDWPKVAEAIGWAQQRSERLLKSSPAEQFAAGLGKKVVYDENQRADGKAVVELNGLINSVIGIARLSDMTAHAAEATHARELLLPLVQERMKFPVGMGTYLRGWEPVLWYDMTPELMRIVAQHQSAAIRAHMDDPAFPDTKFNSRFSRNNFWHLAWGEGCMTDEMTVAMPQVSRSLYALRAFLYEDPPAELYRLADMPWCTDDLYWIEKMTDTLWAYGGRNWQPLAEKP